MAENKWNLELLKQCKDETQVSFETDREKLNEINQDFSRLTHGEAIAFITPHDLYQLELVLEFANYHHLPLTLRANGLSQGGQSLTPAGAVALDISKLNSTVYWKDDKLIAGCSASFKSIIEKAYEKNVIPPVIPYNTNLTLGGVLSVGGLGAASFKYGIIAAHIEEILVLCANGLYLRCNAQNHADLFQGALGGLGGFGIIIEATLNTRAAYANVRSYKLRYYDDKIWLEEQKKLKQFADHLEAYALEMQADKRQYFIQVSKEYDKTPPALSLDLKGEIIESFDKSLLDYLYRHDERINNMAFNAYHPWYECYISLDTMVKLLPKILKFADEGIGGVYHIFLLAKSTSKYFMLPKAENIVTFNVLHPGVFKENVEKFLSSLEKINDLMLSHGGKRYVSGWFRENIEKKYWESHYEDCYYERLTIKEKYDPNFIFQTQFNRFALK